MSEIEELRRQVTELSQVCRAKDTMMSVIAAANRELQDRIAAMAIPEGYVLVPKEAPDNWTQAALHLRCPRCGNKQDIKFERGIVAAAPKP